MNSSQTTAFSGRVLAHLPAEGDWVIEDSLGRRLGWVNGEFISEIPDAYQIPQALGDASLSHRTLYLPEAEYTVGINNSPTETIECTLFGDGRFIEVSGHLRSVGSTTLLSVTPTLDQATLSGLQNLTSFTLLDSELATESRLATVAGIPLSGNEDLNAIFDSDQVIISRAGGNLQYELGLEESNGQLFKSEPLTLEANDTHMLSPTNWTELNSASVILKIDHNSDGTVDEVITLQNVNNLQSGIITKTVIPMGQVEHGDKLTYTLVISAAPGMQLGLYDPLEDTTWVRFVEQPPSVIHVDTVNGTLYLGGVVTGTVTVIPSNQITVSFVAQVGVPGTVGWMVTATNRACVYPLDGTLDNCVWSDEVTNPAFHPHSIYLPLVLRNS